MFFISLLLVQCVTLCVNIFILLAVVSMQHLHTPMYFFLSQLASAEMMFTINIIPNLLHLIVVEGDIISVIGCVTQFYIFSVSTNAESFFLTLMSYDRYIAICNPLYYSSLMSLSFCTRLAIITWIFSFASTLIVIIQLCTLQFCGSNIIDHYYCDLTPLLEHSCSDVSLVKTQIFLFSIPIAVFPFIFIIATYVRIVITILQIPSSVGKQKAFSTCSSHLSVVCIYYLTLITIYVIPKNEHALNLNKSMSLLYTVVTPLMNPIIYTLRNQEIRNIFVKWIWKKIKYA
ncbi:PREDICTED: olfactory receptor 998-like [Nanorana parkeri]|uniref:olfactory receptor 998-like n=1 Tax=Nanorana parkeri TaxID=125878 RepID=UPI000854971F|nr:PREDICTED: olfactory receptor 998-like [Nanorana parkeri]